jgi:hypothetical protein
MPSKDQSISWDSPWTFLSYKDIALHRITYLSRKPRVTSTTPNIENVGKKNNKRIAVLLMFTRTPSGRKSSVGEKNSGKVFSLQRIWCNFSRHRTGNKQNILLLILFHKVIKSVLGKDSCGPQRMCTILKRKWSARGRHTAPSGGLSPQLKDSFCGKVAFNLTIYLKRKRHEIVLCPSILTIGCCERIQIF